MYGLVNKAIQDLVTEKFGEEKWVEIKKLSGFQDDFFVGLQSYPDDLTYTLVKNASKVLGADASVVLELFGDRKSTRLNSSHSQQSRMPSSA